MCGTNKGKLALGGVVVLLTVAIIFGVWMAFRPNSQNNIGDHQSVIKKNESLIWGNVQQQGW